MPLRLTKTGLARMTRRAIRKVRSAYLRRFGPAKLKKMLARSDRRSIVIGSSGWYDAGWVPTDREFLDLLKPADWERFFRPQSIDAMLAEHVWEHLTEPEALAAARRCHDYLKPGGYLRIAVPDGLHPDPTYHEWVRVGGASPGQKANDHKVLYTYRTLGELFERAGFRVTLYEYFDEAGTFHCHEWQETAGKVRRSKRFDARNADGALAFTSIILDAVKPD